MYSLRSSPLSGLERKSPSKRLSIREESLRNIARLRCLDTSGERSAYISLFSSKKASPALGFALKRAAPVRMSCFLDFAWRSESVEGNS